MRNTNYITALRFPLALLIVFIHSYNSIWRGIETGSFPTLPYFFSRILPAFAVPLFFAISGYLFFLNAKNFSIKTYTEKLKRRGFTLFIPYLTWNILAFGLYALKDIASHHTLSFPPSLNLLWGCRTLGNTHTNFLDWTIWSSMAPVLEPFWFVRDLMLVVLVSPLIYLLIRYLRIGGLLLIGAAYYLDLWPNYGGVTLLGFWYFTLGAWFSITDRDVIQTTKWMGFPAFALMFPLGAFIMLYPDFEPSVLIPAQYLYVLCGMIFSVHLANLCCYLFKPGKSLPQSTFFVYAVHTMLLLPLSTLVARYAAHMDSINQALLFFALPVSATVLSLVGYSLICRILPRYHWVLTGNRKK